MLATQKSTYEKTSSAASHSIALKILNLCEIMDLRQNKIQFYFTTGKCRFGGEGTERGVNSSKNRTLGPCLP